MPPSAAAAPAVLTAAALTAEAFAPFGEVIAAGAGAGQSINAGTTARFSQLAQVDCDGGAAVGVFAAAAQPAPLRLWTLECHPRGSQTFLPMSAQPFVVVVAPPLNDSAPDFSQMRAFITSGAQGVNFRRNVWHHPLLSFADSLFAVVDCAHTPNNLQEHPCPQPGWVVQIK